MNPPCNQSLKSYKIDGAVRRDMSLKFDSYFPNSLHPIVPGMEALCHYVIKLLSIDGAALVNVREVCWVLADGSITDRNIPDSPLQKFEPFLLSHQTCAEYINSRRPFDNIATCADGDTIKLW